MNTYHKIQSLYKRYTEGQKKGKFIIGKYSKPEFEFLKDIQWEWTEKIDGTNIRVSWYPNDTIEEIEFKGKTDKAEMPKHLLIKLRELFDISKFKELFPRNIRTPDICLYGEGYGYKIQSGCKYFGGKKEVDFILFDIKIGNIWLKREDVEKIAIQLGIKVVPIVGCGTIDEAIKLVKNSFQSTFGDFIAEGLVIRPKVELKDRMVRRIITKIKYKDFKEKENVDDIIPKEGYCRPDNGENI